MDNWHEYRENQRTTCAECARLFNKYGETDAQVQDVHEFEPITHIGEKKRKRSVSRSKSHKKTRRGGKRKNRNSRKTHKK